MSTTADTAYSGIDNASTSTQVEARQGQGRKQCKQTRPIMYDPLTLTVANEHPRGTLPSSARQPR